MNYISNYLSEVKMICDTIDQEDIESMSQSIIQVKKSGGRLFFIGVGGSAGNCSHAVNDFRKILGIESYAISDNVSELTARINDEGWDTCYSNWLKISNVSNKDAVVVFSVGGGSESTSQNIVKAIELAKNVDAKVLSIVSRDGGVAKKMSDVCILIPVVNEDAITPHAEEWQAIIWHLMVNYINTIQK
jgi:D-sedoheptulose 7-phosphate isomerase